MTSSCALIAHRSCAHSLTHGICTWALALLTAGLRRERVGWSDAVCQPELGGPMETGDDETGWASCRGYMGTTPARMLAAWVLGRRARVRGPGSSPPPPAIGKFVQPVCLNTHSLTNASHSPAVPASQHVLCIEVEHNSTSITEHCLLSLVATREASCHPSEAIETMVRPQRGRSAACQRALHRYGPPTQ